MYKAKKEKRVTFDFPQVALQCVARVTPFVSSNVLHSEQFLVV